MRPVPRFGHGLRRRLRVHQPRRGALGRGPGHLLPPAHAPTGRTTRPPSSRRTTTWYVATPSTTATTPARSARSWAVSGSRSTSSSTPLDPHRKPIGWGTDKAGRRKRLYDAPRTPLDRLLDTGALTRAQKTDLVSYRNQLNPASITCRIIELQDVLIHLAKDKTDQLHLAQIPSILPDLHKGVRVKKSGVRGVSRTGGVFLPLSR